MLDGLQEIWFTLRQNKLRTLLTAFGVFWGIFMLILLLGFGRGMQNGVWEDFGSDVLDFMIVWSGDTSVPYHGMGLGRKIALDEADLQAVKEQINGVRMISGTRRMGDASVTYNGKNSNTELIGIPDEYFHIKEDIPFNYGRKTNPFDEDEIRKVVALGDTVVERLFTKGEDPVARMSASRMSCSRSRACFTTRRSEAAPPSGPTFPNPPTKRCTAVEGGSTTSGCAPRKASNLSNSRRTWSRC